MEKFKTFKPFNRCAPFKPPPSFDAAQDRLSSPASRGMKEGELPLRLGGRKSLIKTRNSTFSASLREPLSYSEGTNAIFHPLSSILNLRLAAHMRGHLLDECILVDGLGDITGTSGGECFLPIALHRV